MERGDAQSWSILSDWPLPRPMRWRDYVNQVQSESEVDAIRASVKRGIPHGTDSWITQSAVRLHLEHTLRSRGRPRQSEQFYKTFSGKRGLPTVFTERKREPTKRRPQVFFSIFGILPIFPKFRVRSIGRPTVKNTRT